MEILNMVVLMMASIVATLVWYELKFAKELSSRVDKILSICEAKADEAKRYAREMAEGVREASDANVLAMKALGDKVSDINQKFELSKLGPGLSGGTTYRR